MPAKLTDNLFAPDIKQVPIRNGYGDGLMVLGKENPNVIVLCCDLTESTRSQEFARAYPDRFVEVGVAEQNLAGLGAGMAHEGKIPFITSYATFSPGRNWDQIRVSICYSGNNVKIVGSHAGISVGPDGATHQAMEDIAMTRVLPRMSVLVPCDALEARKATVASAKFNGPVYIRLAREKTPQFTTEETPFEIGRAFIFRQGKDCTIAAAGPQVYYALQAADQLSKEGIECEVINLVSVKPIDEPTLVTSVKKTGCVVSAEEHQITGGVGGAVAEVLSRNFPVPQEFVGMPDHFGESGEPNELIAKWGMDSKAIIAAVKKVIQRKR
ncbi:MAG: transketolase [Candidatus Doudnabacteria bacterium RIFCSPLOWO2_02_FULL_49_13]|uniref:Transketolase n=1 Tax=Candidatus Doudnabacteria bacterium RIFCSPHIGHO2_12_FULL_48_16 TaxID=1817838 RepID=A0A1F5PJK2_9BACT|nr:MAG: transketolase [Candidatus Doudnabacteria bacterium RIFCSPHIGHO2_02_FULL_49_24]OGE89886.1 MAG: transketolase [Candidatus Doudnabacteria bacterium RIFCSPHIGHO2_01_FULL_50_67]OGE89984.1 MAG: transketolase [Candidatus Doudnabacteria bacterium RIFCSPHIGHO2_12_FULL_48_16]OGE97471.1 MAG: transketolase [Candidatus Doudnabacteria bacterium RIFCSPLOWO2_01_FULL_49_40]OGF03125.1 MAG: transketolase [Candidatus Doudnabacteria bacterium RIFCSPLOWO2_02_FULL_49_13]OGF03723.1 MAG: transketolase [Candida